MVIHLGVKRWYSRSDEWCRCRPAHGGYCFAVALSSFQDCGCVFGIRDIVVCGLVQLADNPAGISVGALVPDPITTLQGGSKIAASVHPFGKAHNLIILGLIYRTVGANLSFPGNGLHHIAINRLQKQPNSLMRRDLMFA